MKTNPKISLKRIIIYPLFLFPFFLYNCRQVAAVMEVLVINCAMNYTMECTSAIVPKVLN